MACHDGEGAIKPSLPPSLSPSLRWYGRWEEWRDGGIGRGLVVAWVCGVGAACHDGEGAVGGGRKGGREGGREYLNDDNKKGKEEEGGREGDWNRTSRQEGVRLSLLRVVDRPTNIFPSAAAALRVC